MPFKESAAVLAFVTTIAAPASAWAFAGVGGCNGLPEYYRALGTLQGNMTNACNMSVEEARRIVAAYDGPAAVQERVTPAPRIQDRRHPTRRPPS